MIVFFAYSLIKAKFAPSNKKTNEENPNETKINRFRSFSYWVYYAIMGKCWP
ncbi:hypothetical protein D3C72_983210 [compost metagenome]